MAMNYSDRQPSKGANNFLSRLTVVRADKRHYVKFNYRIYCIAPGGPPAHDAAACLWRRQAQNSHVSHLEWPRRPLRDVQAGSRASQIEDEAKRLVNRPHLVWANDSLAR